jgi:hypothetical protein
MTVWTYEVHELSEGDSAIVYDERGRAVADHLSEEHARLIAAAPEMLAALKDTRAALAFLAWDENAPIIIGLDAAIADHLEGRLALQYIGNCKCGQCYIVPAPLIEGAVAAIRSLQSPPSTGEPVAFNWRAVIQKARDQLGQAGGIGTAGAQNSITEREIGGWILDYVEDELAALTHPSSVSEEAVEQWQSIETAPKDGAYILVYQTGVLEPSQVVCCYEDDWWQCCDGKNTELPLRGPAPTHWRPLPAPPALQQGGNNG